MTTTIHGFRRLVSWAVADDLTAFVIPDLRIAHAMGLDLTAAGLRVVCNPWHATVLLIVGELPPVLAEAAAVVNTQMPWTRVVLAVGSASTAFQSEAGIAVPADQAGLVDGVRQVRRRLVRQPQPVDVTPGPPLATASTLADHDQAREAMASGPHEHGQMESKNAHSDTDDPTALGRPDHSTMNRGVASLPPHSSMDLDSQIPTAEVHSMKHADHGMTSNDGQPMNHSEHNVTDHSDHDKMGHSGHDMMGGGFMSMIAMTRDLPRSRDGLQMEWREAPFGPLFAGLPAGLALSLTLDGDTVAKASVRAGIMHRGVVSPLPFPLSTLADRLARINPLAPTSYVVLAYRAVEAIGTPFADNDPTESWVGALERERAVSHLGWLAAFADLLGVAWLTDRAARLQMELQREDNVAGIGILRPQIDRFVHDVNRLPLLRRRLSKIGTIGQSALETTIGPVARGADRHVDARIDDPAYAALAFAPLVRSGNDAAARLAVRLAEIGQSLDLVAGSRSLAVPPPNQRDSRSGAGTATIETPRGRASLRIETADGLVTALQLNTPSVAHLTLVPEIVTGQELADALVAVASLDLSAWEIDQ